MNSLSDFIKSYLIVSNSTDYLEEIYKLCLEKIHRGGLVLILTSKLYDFSNLLEPLNINKDQLNNLIIMHYNTIDEISRKLLQLYNWTLLPTMVVVDLFYLIQLESFNSATNSVSLIQKVTLCTVSLLAYLQSIALQQGSRVNASTSFKTIQGLLILKIEGEHFGESHLQLIKNLYFYKTKIYQDISDVSSKVLHEWVS